MLLTMMASTGTMLGQTTWEKATSIQVGDVVVLVTENSNNSTTKMELTSFSSTSTVYGIGTAYTSTPACSYTFEVVAGNTDGTFAFKHGSSYLYWTSGNSLNVNSTLSDNTSWTVSIDGTTSKATIKNAADDARQIWWNVSSPRFACYTGKTEGNSYYITTLYKQVTGGGGDTPSISANNVDIAYDATQGSIAYILNNGTGNVGATITSGDWITLGTITASAVPFTCSANTAAAARTATVTLTYTGASNKVVTITQAGNPNVVNNISDITAAGNYTVKGTIVAKSTRGFILGDGTGYVYYYKGSAVDQNVGDIVKISGAVSASNYKVYQFTNSAEITTATESNYVAEDPTVLSGADMDAVVTGSNVLLSNYIQYQGTLTVNNNTYYNITSIDGATTAKGSISYPTSTDFASLNGKVVTVTGYFVGVSSSQYYNTMIGSIEEVVGGDPYITADDVNLTHDATSGIIEFEIQNYVAGTMTATTEATWITDFTYDQDEANGEVGFTTTQNTTATARTATVTLTYTYGNSQTVTKNVTVTQAAAPYTTIESLFNAATSTATNVTVAFNNWVVSGVSTNGKNVFVTDGTNGFVIYSSTSMSETYSAGHILNGTITCSLKLQNGYAQLTNVEGLTITDGGTVTPANIAMADLVGVNTGALVHYENLTCSVDNNKYYLSDGTTTLQVYNAIYAFGSAFVASHVYNITGVYQQYNTTNANTKEILPRSADDIEEVVISTPSITVSPATVNAPVDGVDGTLTVTYENFTDIAADVWFCNAAGTEDATYDWITASINNSTNNVDYLVEQNGGEARTAYFKVWAYDDGMNEVYSNLVTVTQAEYVAPTYAELPFAFDGGRADIANTDGLYQDGLGTDYSASPKLKFDNTGDWLLLQFQERPGTLTFDIKGNGFSDGTFKVQTSEDGTTYTDLETYTDLGNTQSESFNNLGENVRYIKWIYTEKINGNVALGNIALEEYVAPVASITVDPDLIEAPATPVAPATAITGSLTVTLSNITITELDQLGVDFCDENGTLLTGTNTKPSWFESEFELVNEEYKLNYTIATNTETTERVAYFKVYEVDSEVYSNKVTVTQEAYIAPTATITLDGYAINAPAAETEGNLAITLENIVITETGGGEFDMVFCDNQGTPLPDQSAKPEWFGFDFPYENDAWSVYYIIGENTTTEERTAYFKVYGLGDDGNTEAYSELVTVTQAGATGPMTTGTIAFGSAEGSTAITTASLNGQSATDNMGNTWTITTVFSGETSFTQNAAYSQVGASSKPATSITFTTTLAQETVITAFEAKFGGFNGTAGDINLLIGETNVGSGSLDASNDVTVTNTSTAAGTTLTVTVTNIAKGVKCYYISYTISASTDPMINAPASIDLASDATEGEIEYSIINPATGVNLEATTTTSWISGITVTDEKVTFTTTANTETTERQGTITLSYQGADDKDVTIIQAAYVPPVVMTNYALFTGDLVEGDYIIYYNGYAMKNTVTSGRLDNVDVDPENNVIATDNVAIIWHIAPNNEGYWTIYSADANAYAASTGVKNKAQMLEDGTDDMALWTVTGTETFEFVNKANEAADINKNLRNNGTNGWACYSTQTGGALTLFKKVTSTVVYNKTINGYGDSEKSGYYLIASPIYGLDPESVAGMTTGTFDLYRFDQTAVAEWQNYEVETFYLTPGKGYLYAKNTDITLNFEGMPYEGDGTINLTYDENATFAGWNLIGNPFGSNATLDQPYYRLNPDADAISATTETSPIEKMEGVFVEATAASLTAKFTTQTRSAESKAIPQANILVKGNRGNIVDNAIIRFDGGQQLGKFSFNENNTKVYIPQEGKDYAVVNAENAGEMPVNFKAAENGTYTIDFSMDNVEFNYLHLIDNKTGMDIDLMQTSSYTFEASKTDYASRFRLLFSTNGIENSNDNNDFGFFDASGNLLVLGIEGKATLQLIDVTGRILSSETFSGNYSKAINASAGVYMLRLIQGNDVRTQKIVVK